MFVLISTIINNIISLCLSVVRIIWILILFLVNRLPSGCLLSVLSLRSVSWYSNTSSSLLPVHQAVPVHVQRHPVLAPAVHHRDPLVQVVEHHLLVLLQQFASELGENLQECEVRRSSS